MTTRDLPQLIRKARQMIRKNRPQEKVAEVVNTIPNEQVNTDNLAAGYVFMFKKVVDYLEGKDGRDVIVYDF